MTAPTFVALDFETADSGPDSACAIGIVKVRGGEIVAREHRLIRPPRPTMLFTWVHGIKWEDVENEPGFAEVWRAVEYHFQDVEFVAAHNADFDRRVLAACCQATGQAFPQKPFLCTVQLARRVWRIYPTKLPDVCRALQIPLKHHEALSDAEACARIVIASQAMNPVDQTSPDSLKS